jgi:hypothetical protein
VIAVGCTDGITSVFYSNWNRQFIVLYITDIDFGVEFYWAHFESRSIGEGVGVRGRKFKYELTY